MYSQIEEIVIVVTQFLSAPVSAIASGMLMVMIRRSDLKMSTPSRRIFFGLCFYDFVYSFGASFSTLPIPKGQGMWGAIGNLTTCTMQGLCIQFGFVGSMLYNCSLSIYYVSVIRFSKSEEEFKTKIEPFLHVIANIYPIATSTYLFIKKYFNSVDHLCWVASYPKECTDDPNVECIRGGENLYSIRLICFGYVVYTAVFVITINMVLIVSKVITVKRKNNRWKFGRKAGRSSSTAQMGENLTRTPRSQQLNHSQHLGGIVENEEPPMPKSDYEDPHPFDLNTMRASIKSNNGKTENADAVPSGRRTSCFSPNVGNEKSEDPHPFDLKAMRAGVKLNNVKTKDDDAGPSGRRTSCFSLNVENGNNEDPHPFDLKAMRQKKDSLSTKLKRKSSTTSILSEGPENEQSEDVESLKPPSDPKGESNLSTSLLRRSSRRGSRKKSERVTNESANDERRVAVQALLYISAFFSSVFFSGTVRVLESKGIVAPFIIYELSRIFSPIQGFFNILIYSRPHVISRRNNDPEISWLKAFWMTVKTGGDNNNAGRSRRVDHKASKRMRERIQQSHLTRMAKIREDAEKKRIADLERLSTSKEAKTNSHQEGSQVPRRFSLSVSGRRLSLKLPKKQEDSSNNDIDDKDQVESTDLEQTSPPAIKLDCDLDDFKV